MQDQANDRKRLRSESGGEVNGNVAKKLILESANQIVKSAAKMSMEHKCYCRGDEVTSLDLNRPEHLMPMMRPFSMRLTNLETILVNMFSCRMLTEYLYRGNGKFLVGLWRKTSTMDYEVPILDTRHLPESLGIVIRSDE